MDNVAIYCRLSDEDRFKKNDTDESESIQNQKSMLLSYALENGWNVYKIYCDEDYSGADRNRPSWCEMINDAQNRKFNIILCKTQSRFSRDMEIIEKYLHNKFIEWNIRFLGIVDHTDTQDIGNKKSRQINGLVNEWYLEDVSNNIKKTLNHKKQSGEWVGSFAPYGYMEDINNKNHLAIDPVASEVVKCVFDMYLKGMGYSYIAKKLNEMCIPNPSTYKKINGSKFKTNTSKITSSLWTDSTIYQIVRREVYVGNLVQGISENISYKNKKRKKRPQDTWYITKNAHEPIIDIDTWEKVLEKLKSKKRSSKFTGETHILSGKVFCSECKNTMWKMSYSLVSGRYKYLKCKTTKSSTNVCTNNNSLRLDSLINIIKDEINNLLREFYNPNLIKINSLSNNDKINALNIENENLQKLIEKKELYLQKAYIDKLDNVISNEQFLKYNELFQNEISRYKNRINNIIIEINHMNKNIEKVDILKKYYTIEELDRQIIDEFIDVIHIGNKTENGREIEIKWKL